MAHRSPFRRLAVESLEDRRLLAGNVLATLRAGDLVLRGDAADNQIQVARLTTGVYRVQGLAGTTVNGQATFDAGTGVRDVDVRMQQGGSDQFTIQGAFNLAGHLDIRLGAGNVLIEGSAGPVPLATI